MGVWGQFAPIITSNDFSRAIFSALEKKRFPVVGCRHYPSRQMVFLHNRRIPNAPALLTQELQTVERKKGFWVRPARF